MRRRSITRDQAIDQVIKMNERLAVAGLARERIVLELFLVDAADLLGDRHGVTVLIVDAGDPQ